MGTFPKMPLLMCKTVLAEIVLGDPQTARSNHYAGRRVKLSTFRDLTGDQTEGEFCCVRCILVELYVSRLGHKQSLPNDTLNGAAERVSSRSAGSAGH
jgi:hypothetical protein